MYREFFVVLSHTFMLSVLVCSLVHISLPVFGQVMSSSNFSLQSDSINFGGGNSTSSNYSLESTGGEIATGQATSSSYQLRAGYQQMQAAYLSLSVPGGVELSPSLFGITGGTSTGAIEISVITDNPAGYTLSLRAEGEPAMQAGSSTIADYMPAGGVPDFVFSLTPTDAVFGFTPEGDDIDIRYRDSGGVCGVSGSDTIQRCWEGMSTSSIVIARSTAPNHPDGVTTTVRFQVGLGGMIAVPLGTYVATSTVIAIPL